MTFIKNWMDDLKVRPCVFFCEGFGTAFAIIAAILLAVQQPKPHMYLIYLFYILGSVLIGISSYMRKNGFWWLLSCFFVSVDLIGVFNLLRG